jgi:hypothetical protein
MRITKAVEGHMKADERRRATSVFHERRQCDDLMDLGCLRVDADGKSMAVPSDSGARCESCEQEGAIPGR